MKKIVLFAFATFLVVVQIHAQQISGTVYDTKYDRPVERAHVVVSGTNLGAYTDAEGHFSIEDVPEGEILVRTTLVGYLPLEKSVGVSDAGGTELNLYLQPTSISLNNTFAVTARRVETSDFVSPEAITLINSRDLYEESPRTVPEALDGQAGVYVQQTNLGGGSPFIRGLTGNQNLLMIDGIRFNNATYRYGPNQYLSTIDPYLVQQLEVVRGAGSVLYGSDAMGGVVNVITRDPEFSSYGWKTGAGLYGKWMSDEMQKSGRGEISISNKTMAFMGGFTYNDFGDIVGGDTTGKQTPTGYTGYAADAKLRLRLTERNELQLAYQYDRQDDVPRYDKLISGYARYHFDPQIRQLGYLRFKSTSDNKWLRQITLTGSLNQSDETRILQKENSEKVTNEHDLVNTWGAVAEVNSVPAPGWHFQSGIEFYYDKINSDKTEREGSNINALRGYYPDGATSASFALYTTHTLDVRSFSFILGGRFNAYHIQADDPEFGDVDVSPAALVGSASAVYHAGSHYNLIASLYSAFRAPNLNDLSSFGTFNYGVEVPNPDLKPERSLNTEVGVKTRYERFSGSLFLYNNRLSNLIERTEARYDGQDSLNGEKVYRKENFAKAFIRGIEAEAQYELVTWLSLYGNVSYTYGQNESLDEPMRRIPPLNGRLGIRYAHPEGFWVRLEWLSAAKQDRLASGDISDSRIPEGGTPGWNVLNLRAGYTWKWLNISSGLNNIFNEDYRTHGSGINGYGRSFWLSLHLSF